MVYRYNLLSFIQRNTTVSDKKNAIAQRREAKLKLETANERQKALKLRSEVKDLKAEIEDTDWMAVAFGVGSGLAGNGASGLSRAMGWTEGRTHYEPLAAVGLGFLALRSDMPNGVGFAQGLAARWVSERVETSVRELRNAVDAKKVAADADVEAASDAAEKAPVEQSTARVGRGR
jgi:hypothetical protein